MLMFVLQSALLIAIAFLLGAIAGCLLHRMVSQRTAAVAGHPVKTADAPARFEPRPEPARVAPRAKAPEPERREEPSPEPIAEKTVVTAAPKAEDKPAAATVGGKDDLKRIRGIGKQNEKKLNDAGIATYAQIAAWSPADQAAWGQKLAFPGRIEREDWVGQAKILSAGGEPKLAGRAKDESKGG
jgi:predicted flap endonuclease-1-like 5' DNA nuclease